MERLAHDWFDNRAYRFALALMCIAPCVVALFASSALAHRAKFSYSGLWFIYEVSFFVGCVGVAITAVLAIVEAVRRQVSVIFPLLVGLLAAIGISLLWYAGHVYQNPWTPRI